MTGSLIGLAALLGLLAWFLVPRNKPAAAPEDDITTPLDHDELAEAEAEVMSEDARPINEALGEDGDDDDWGPGASRSNLPGIL